VIEKIVGGVVKKLTLPWWEDYEDAFQSGYVMALEALERFNPDKGVPRDAWIFIAVRGRLSTERNKERKRKILREKFLMWGEPQRLEQQTVERDLATRVLNSKILTKWEREVVFRRCVVEEDGVEIAREFGVGTSVVNKSVRKAIEKLKRRWGSRVG